LQVYAGFASPSLLGREIGAPFMYGRLRVTNKLLPVWTHNATSSYSNGFFFASITVMATVCRFSPSQLHGAFGIGSGNHKDASSLPYRAERQSGLSIAYWWRFWTCTSFAQDQSSFLLKGWISSKTEESAPYTVFISTHRDSVIRTCETGTLSLAQIEG
jgi:hypothetical protein